MELLQIFMETLKCVKFTNFIVEINQVANFYDTASGVGLWFANHKTLIN